VNHCTWFAAKVKQKKTRSLKRAFKPYYNRGYKPYHTRQRYVNKKSARQRALYASVSSARVDPHHCPIPY